VGGTGVITIGQLLGMAAHIEGKGVVTQDAGGLAQKGGATWSHVQIANRPDAIRTTKVDTAKADLVMAATRSSPASTRWRVMQPGRTHVALNTHRHADGGLCANPAWQFPGRQCETAVTSAVGLTCHGQLRCRRWRCSSWATAIYTNPLMLGFAWQKGWLPLGHAALMRAIELNGVQVDNNKAAFEWGRGAARTTWRGAGPRRPGHRVREAPSLARCWRKRVDFLTAYQNAAYAAEYQQFVEQGAQAESALGKTG
jgi:indolepyruvate ferredoxin oxidoreductase